WEDGLLVPSPKELEKLAPCLSFDPSFFECDADVSSFATSCMYHRKRQRISAKLLNQIHATVNLVGIGVMRLLKNVSFNTKTDFPTMDVDQFDGPERVSAEMR